MENSPYVGPAPYERDDRHYFGGRNSEARDVAALIEAHSLTLLYSPSGAGKTSLLNAGVAKILSSRGANVLPLARVGGSSGNNPGQDNVFLSSLTWSFKNLQSPEGPRELNTIYSILVAQVKLSRQNNRLPTLVVMMIDQFEELFTKHVDQWKQREPFLKTIAALLSLEPQLRILFAMREEYLANLDPFAHLLPGGLENRFRLPLLDERSALEACIEPARNAGVGFQRATDPQKDAASALLNALRQVPDAANQFQISEFIEPLQLQVVCRTLWGKLREGTKEITVDDVNRLGDVQDALEQYYEDTIAKAASKTAQPSGALRRWIEERLVLPDGSRNLVYVDTHASTVAGMPLEVVETLTELQLIRPEVRGGRQWYELSHDRFVSAIKTANERWRARVGGTGLLLELTAREYIRSGRPPRLLLLPDQLKTAEEWLKSPDAKAYGLDDAVSELVRNSRDHIDKVQVTAQAETARRQLQTLIRSLPIILALLVGGIVSWYQIGKHSAELYARQQSEAMADAANRLGNPDSVSRGDGLVSGGDLAFVKLYLATYAVGSLVHRGVEPPESELRTLTEASKLLGTGLFLPRQKSFISHVSISRAGDVVLLAGSDLVTVWDWRKPAKLKELAPRPGFSWLSASFAGKDGFLVLGQGALAAPSLNDAFERSVLTLPKLDHPQWLNQLSSEERSNCCDFSSDGATALVYSSRGARTLDAVTGAQIANFPRTSGGPAGAYGFVTGTYVLAGTNVALCTPENASCTIYKPDSGYLATLDASSAVQNGKHGFDVPPYFCKFSEDGRFAMMVPPLPQHGPVNVVTWEIKDDNASTRKTRRVWPLRNLRLANFSSRTVNGAEQFDQILVVDSEDLQAQWLNPSTGDHSSEPNFFAAKATITHLLQKQYAPTIGLQKLVGLLSREATYSSTIPADVSDADVSDDGGLMVLLRASSYPVIISNRKSLDASAESTASYSPLEQACKQLKYQMEYNSVKEFCSNRAADGTNDNYVKW